jgi:hypothetical protein
MDDNPQKANQLAALTLQYFHSTPYFFVDKSGSVFDFKKPGKKTS